MIKYLKYNWFLILLLLIFTYLIINGDSNINSLKEENKKLSKEIKNLELIISNNLKLIDSLSKIDTIYIDSIKIIKEDAQNKIIYVDSMSISDKQKFFTDRYNSKN